MKCYIDIIEIECSRRTRRGVDCFLIKWCEEHYGMFFNGYYLLKRKTLTEIMDEISLWRPKLRQ